MRFLIVLAALTALAAGARADEISAWEKVAETTVRAERLPAAQAEQALDMVRAAIDDAVNATAPFGGVGPSADVAAAVAAHDVLVKLFPTRRARLDARLDQVRVTMDESVVEASASAGRRAAKAVLASEWDWRARLHEKPRRLPAIKSLTLPLHKTAAGPIGLTKPDTL
jgi:hypothetical protein